VQSAYPVEPAVAVEPAYRVRRGVSVRGDLPHGNGKVQVVKATAEVRIYGRERMDIHLYRQ